MIDGEKLLGDYLRQHADVVDMDTRIVGQSPRSKDTSWVRLTQLDAPIVNRARSGHLYEFYFQLDCYAGKDGIGGSQQREANELAGAIHDALKDLDSANHQADGAVITGAIPNMGARIPDQDFEPARERYVSTARVYIHG